MPRSHFVGHCLYEHFAVLLDVLSHLFMMMCVRVCVCVCVCVCRGVLLCWLSHIQPCCCGCKTASGISMYKQAYKWSTIWLFIFILLTVNKAEQALTPSNKWRPTHANSSAAGNPGGLFELRSIVFRLCWSWDIFFLFVFVELFCESNNVFMYSEIWCNECDCVCWVLCWCMCLCVCGMRRATKDSTQRMPLI